MSAGRPSKKPRTESSSSSSMSESKSVTYPVINRVASGANVRGMPAYQAMYVFFPFFIFFFFIFLFFGAHFSSTLLIRLFSSIRPVVSP